jgi:UDP-N-acetylmuramoyl-tripeptide--D-alanyl-D-alanine ligase
MRTAARPTWHAAKINLAQAYRPFLKRVCFVGVTGSCGKTTTLELIAAILATSGRVRKCSAITNPAHRIAGNILTTLPFHRFCVNELGGFRPGALANTTALLRPQVGLVTAVEMDHYSAFKSLDATAKEKGTLIESLPDHGIAVLNADNQYVAAMSDRTNARVITYGLSPTATVRGEDVSSVWPCRLSLNVTYEGRRIRVQTQLLGEHWASAVLAALAVGVALGIPLDVAARTVKDVAPVEGRMSPHVGADGITFIQDTWKSPLYSMPLVLGFLESARVQRKVLVIGSISDYRGNSKRKFRNTAREALKVADKILFVGRWSHYGLTGRAHPDDDRILAFKSLYEAQKFLRGYLASGDLVMLKGSNRNDHFERVILDHTDGIACWRVDCRKRMYCQDCRLRNDKFEPC